MLGLSGKTEHFQLNHTPKKSTLTDANERRDVEVFGKIYEGLLKKYGHLLSYSRIKVVIKKKIIPFVFSKRLASRSTFYYSELIQYKARRC